TFGKDTTLGSEVLKTGVLIVTKRLDTGSPWPLGNNPKGKYFRAPKDAEWISNADYPLWKVVRASTAAPSFFDPETILISRKKGKKAQIGEFVDGGVSPFNNPTLQALMYATLDGYRVRWKVGAENLLIVSVGTGMDDPSIGSSRVAAGGAVKSLLGLMKDCATLMETMMQWIGTSPTSRPLDAEIQDLSTDQLGNDPFFTYLRFDLPFTREGLEPLKPGLKGSLIKSLSEMDNPENLDLLKELGDLAGNKQVRAHLFPDVFDLRH
ncbi:MAG: patatin-like phospholipase family protein, partial [Longimicrobiales bacterium]